MHRAIQDFLFDGLDLRPDTQRWYRDKLKTFEMWVNREKLDILTLTPADIRAYLDWRKTQRTPRTDQPLTTQTIKGDAQVVKTLYRWLAREEVYGVSEKLPTRIKVPKADTKVIETFTRDQIRRLMLACANEHSRELQERDKAILRVLLGTGIRASELCGLTLENTILDLHDARIKVLGKGRKQRVIGLGVEVRKSLYRYITRWRTAPERERHVFLGRGGGPFTPDGLDQMLYRLRDWAGVSGVRVSAHTFRHTFATEFLKQTGDIYKLSRLLGHSSVTVTEVYLRAVQSWEAGDGMQVFEDL